MSTPQMAFEPERIYKFDNEANVWEFLSDIVDHRIPARRIALDFSEANWARLSIKFKGAKYKQSLPTSTMRGFVDLQNSYYRSVALLIRDSTYITRLTDDDRLRHEFVFRISFGSIESEADGKGGLIDVARQAVSNMTSRDTLIAIGILAISIYGSSMFNTYIAHNVDLAKIDAESHKDEGVRQTLHELIAANGIKDALIERALAQSPKGKIVFDETMKGIDSVVKHSPSAAQIQIQGTQVGRSAADELRKSNRTRSEFVTETDMFIVLGVDATNLHSFRVKLQSVDGDISFVADLQDAVGFERYHRVISSAEWNRRPIRIQFSAKRIADQYVEAKILRASNVGTRIN